MVGFLLNDDATEARRNVFDSWIDERKQDAERAAQQVQQVAQQTAQQQASEVAARAQQFQDWVGQQNVQQAPQQAVQPTITAPAALEAAPQPAPPVAPPAAPSATAPVSPESGDEVAARARQFQDWITEQAQRAAPMPQPPADVFERGAPSLPPSEEPATPTDQIATAADSLGGKWKTSFDHKATYTGDYRTGTPHRGIDLVPQKGGIGTSVEAFAPGTVTNISRDAGAGGNMVYVQDDQGLTHAYMHLQGAAPGLAVGQKVARGQPIAQMGESGTEGSPHLHYEVRKNAATGDPLDQLIDPRPYIAAGGQATTPPSRFSPSGRTTAELSGGGSSGGMNQRAQSIMSEAGQAAAAFGGDAAKAVQAVLVTEGGMNNARGDNGQSAGPLQFYGGGGQLNNFARNLGVPLEDAKRWVEENPVAAVRWALGTPDAPGYLGRALLDGIQKGLSGSALATHIQRTGQVSVSPERAGANYDNLFGQGQEAIRSIGTGAVEGALEAGRQVAGRAGELVEQGRQLAEQGGRGAEDAWRQLESAQAKARAESDRWLAEQRARGEEWDVQRQRRDLDWQRSLEEGMRGFGERAQGFTAPLAQGAETARDFFSGDLAARNREAPGLRPVVSEEERAAAMGQVGQMFPRNPLEVAGAMVRGVPGTPLGGTLTLPEWQRLEQGRRRDVSGFVRENVPGGNEPVIGGALQMAAEELTSPTNIVLAGPLMGLGRGVAALAGGGTRGAIADWAVQGAIFSAVTEASKPDATPESVGEAFLAGGAFGGGIRGAGAVAIPAIGKAGQLGRQLLNAPEFQQVLRSRARGEAEVGFAAGVPTRGRGALRQAPTLEPPDEFERVFHGGAGAFDRPNPELFDPDGLVGPAYYLTSDPRVAGGIVSEGTTMPASVVGGMVHTTPEALQATIDARIGRLKQMQAANPIDPQLVPLNESISRMRDDLQRMLEARQPGRVVSQGYAQARGGEGANVRAVDVPRSLRLFDFETPLPPQDAQAIARRLWGQHEIDVSPDTQAEIASWSTRQVDGSSVYDVIRGEIGGSKAEANKVLADAGFDGISYAGGSRIPMPDATGLPIEHQVTAVFPESLDKIRNAISGRQGGFAQAPFAARLGGAAVGGYGGWETAPEEEREPAFRAGPVEVPSGMRVGRAIVGAGAGLAVPGIAQAAITRPQLRQDMLERLRSAGIAQAAPQPSRPAGFTTGGVVDVTKQLILTNPAGRVLDLVGNTLELLRQPIALTMGGQGPEAAAGTAAIIRGLPEAFQNAVQALQGHQVATLGQGAQDIGRSKPIFKILAAGDIFTRTLGEYQGMASRAVSMLNKAGIEPGTPQAEQYLAQHVDELHREAVRSGTGSVFGSAQRGANASPLDKLMSKLSDAKEGLLNSPRKRDQALGALLDLNIPFSGTPSRVLQIGLQRIPGITQAAGAARIAAALQKGDTFAAQKALGEVTTETLIQLRIAQGITEGNITGPDDPEHPSSMQVNGAWYPLRTLGVYGMPAGIMAAFAESWEKTGREPELEVQERFAAALNASMEPLLDAVPGFAMMNTLAAMGRGGFTGAVEKQAADAMNRLLSPALVAQANNRLDPTMRDVHKRGWESLWEPLQAKTPFLSRFLPPKLDPTTGEPMTRGVTALGGAVKMSSPVRVELARLKREGYDLNPPTDKPSSITIRGVPVPVKDGSPEQRAMVQARGQFLAETSDQMTKPSYMKMSDDQKAKFWSRMIDRSARKQEAAWRDNVDPERAARILATGKRVVGRVRDVEDETELINRQVLLASQLRRQQQRSA
jgi:murein DD-endopeptidase MepM/ murein hydrolase activator NlpD